MQERLGGRSYSRRRFLVIGRLGCPAAQPCRANSKSTTLGVSWRTRVQAFGPVDIFLISYPSRARRTASRDEASRGRGSHTNPKKRSITAPVRPAEKKANKATKGKAQRQPPARRGHFPRLGLPNSVQPTSSLIRCKLPANLPDRRSAARATPVETKRNKRPSHPRQVRTQRSTLSRHRSY